MIINTCKTADTFKDKDWMRYYVLFHEDLDLKCLPPNDQPLPKLLDVYWNDLWKCKEDIGKEYLNASNIHIKSLGRIWEYIQILGSINYISNDNIIGKKILSLGAGIEPNLYILAKLGAKVNASDIYNSPDFWFPFQLDYLKKNSEIFSQYINFKPKINFFHLNLKNRKELNLLGEYDIIYSISSLEHIYSLFSSKKRLFKNIIKHLSDDGIFSFTTELIIKYDRTINFKKLPIIIRSFLKTRKSSKNVITHVSKSYFMNYQGFKMKDLFRKVFVLIYDLSRYNRRYDFFTKEELKAIIKLLWKKKCYLVDNVNWSSCSKFAIKSDGFKNHYHTSIALTFRKSQKNNHVNDY
jgi:SAM-dependent methyltransferase